MSCERHVFLDPPHVAVSDTPSPLISANVSYDPAPYAFQLNFRSIFSIS